jgi:outer membrane lipoprotein SlyB
MSQEEKQINENNNVVLAFFADRAAADSAVEGLKIWDKVNEQFDLGTIGIISKEGDKIKTHVGRKTGKGAAIGAAVGTTVGGGALGHFFKKSMNLTREEIAEIGKELDGGSVAVVVACDDFEIPMVTEYLVGSKGKVRTYAVPQEALAEAATAPEVMDAVSEETA